MIFFVFILSVLINWVAIAAHLIPLQYISIGVMVVEPVLYLFFALFSFSYCKKNKKTKNETFIVLVTILLGRVLSGLIMCIADIEYIYQSINGSLYMIETIACISLSLMVYFIYSGRFILSIFMVSALLMVVLSPLRTISISNINFSLLIEPICYFLFTYIVLLKKKLKENSAFVTALTILLGSVALYVIMDVCVGTISHSSMLTAVCNVMAVVSAYIFLFIRVCFKKSLNL